MNSSQTTSRELHINDIVPYWRNPRIIPEESVNAVAESIERYGYVQPIVVDSDNVIVIGHTRYSALRRLGVEYVEVQVTELDTDKANQLRVMDNRVGEYGEWDFNKLVEELENLDSELMFSYFPEAGAPENVEPDIRDEEPDSSQWNEETDRDAEFICPACFHEFVIHITSEKVKAGKI